MWATGMYGSYNKFDTRLNVGKFEICFPIKHEVAY